MDANGWCWGALRAGAEVEEAGLDGVACFCREDVVVVVDEHGLVQALALLEVFANKAVEVGAEVQGLAAAGRVARGWAALVEEADEGLDCLEGGDNVKGLAVAGLRVCAHDLGKGDVGDAPVVS